MRVGRPILTLRFSAGRPFDLRGNVTLSSEADHPQALQRTADESCVTLDNVFTRSWRDRIERTLVVTAVLLVGTVTGISIWAQRSSSDQIDVTTSHVRAVQAAQVSSSDLAAARTVAARRRAVARTSARLAPLSATLLVTSTRNAAAAEQRALALPTGKAAARAQSVAASHLVTDLKLLNVT